MIANITLAQFGHLRLSFGSVGFYECSKLLPVSDFVPIPPMHSDFGIKVTRFPPTLKPCIDGIG